MGEDKNSYKVLLVIPLIKSTLQAVIILQLNYCWWLIPVFTFNWVKKKKKAISDAVHLCIRFSHLFWGFHVVCQYFYLACLAWMFFKKAFSISLRWWREPTRCVFLSEMSHRRRGESLASLYSIIPLGYFHPPFSYILSKYFQRTQISYQLPKCSPWDFSLCSCYVAVS